MVAHFIISILQSIAVHMADEYNHCSQSGETPRTFDTF